MSIVGEKTQVRQAFGGLGDRIRAARQGAGLSQFELAEHTCRSERWVREVELGRIDPPGEYLAACCDELTLTPNELFGLGLDELATLVAERAAKRVLVKLGAVAAVG